MSRYENICPVCEQGGLHESTFADDFRHGDRIIHISGLECFKCENCGADPVFEDQIRRNHDLITAVKNNSGY